MKKIVSLLFSFLLIISGVAGQDLRKEFSVSKGQTLDVDLRTGGSIEIRGWDKDLADIQIRFIECDPDDFEFEFTPKRSGLMVRSESKRHIRNIDIQVSVMIPSEFSLYLKTIGGEISIQDIKGKIEGRTAGGALTLDNLKGEIYLATGGGPIILIDSQIDGRVTTGGGSVLVENVEGDIEATSGGGNVVYKNVKTPFRTYPADQVYIRNAGGALKVEEAPAGADVQTGGGNIRILSASEFVKATTGGGDITIDAVDGWVKATTGAGDIRVTMVGDPEDGKRHITLVTGTGGIYVTVPKNLSMDVDIELAYTKNNTGKYKITSDFKLREGKTDTWDNTQGTPRKYIFGKASIQGGRNEVIIRTVNGNVHLRSK